MTQEERNLLIRDLCARLPYGVKVRVLVHKDDPSSKETLVLNGFDGSSEYVFWTHDEEKLAKYGCRGRGYRVGEVKPYLRPMISMTEDEENQFQDVNLYELTYTVKGLDWLNAHHFDYRGLINDGLALEATDGIYENVSDLAIDNTTKITVGCKIRSKTNPDVILSIVSDDCHGDKFECSNGSVLSLKQIKKHYDIYIEENKGTIVIN